MPRNPVSPLFSFSRAFSASLPATDSGRFFSPPGHGRRGQPPPVQDDCPHREWSAGHRSFGPNIPAFAQGAYFPGDEPGARCQLSGEACDPHPAFCPLWRPSNIACPACPAFMRRRRPRGLFRQSRLLARGADKDRPAAPRSSRLYCPACDEEYTGAVALAALERLRDLLDDLDSAGNLTRPEGEKTWC